MAMHTAVFSTLLFILAATISSVHSIAFDPERRIILFKDGFSPEASPDIVTVKALGFGTTKSSNTGPSAERMDEMVARLNDAANLENSKMSIASIGASPQPKRPSRVTGSFSRSKGSILNAIHGTFSDAVLESFKQEFADEIVTIEPDYVARINGTTIYQQATPASWGLWRASEWYSSKRPYYYSSTSGAGVDIWIVDTGIKTSIADFGGRASNSVSFVTTETSIEDTHGHGSFVAGIAGSFTYGIAKRANIRGIKTMDANGEGLYSWIIAGIDYIAPYIRKGKTVINLSLGGVPSKALNGALQRASALGAVVVVASGNEAKDACTTSPGGASGIMSVGATDMNDNVARWAVQATDGDVTLASFSNYGTCVSLFAPGVDIQSQGLNGPMTMSGTSMASPHVAGVAALWLADWAYDNADSLYRDLKAYASTKQIKGLTSNSPDRLLYSWGDYKY